MSSKPRTPALHLVQVRDGGNGGAARPRAASSWPRGVQVRDGGDGGAARPLRRRARRVQPHHDLRRVAAVERRDVASAATPAGPLSPCGAAVVRAVRADSLPSSLLGIRDRAVLPLNSVAALRLCRSEPMALAVPDVTARPECHAVLLDFSKTDQESAGAT